MQGQNTRKNRGQYFNRKIWASLIHVEVIDLS